MATAPYAITGWWRYSDLNGYQVGGELIVTVLLWVDVLMAHGHTVALVAASTATWFLCVRATQGVVRAERARRYGCW